MNLRNGLLFSQIAKKFFDISSQALTKIAQQRFVSSQSKKLQIMNHATTKNNTESNGLHNSNQRKKLLDKFVTKTEPGGRERVEYCLNIRRSSSYYSSGIVPTI